MRRLEGRVALITGSSRGIGRAVAIRAAKEGAKVAVNYLRNRKAADEVVQMIRNGGGEAIAIQADVSDSKQVELMVATVLEKFGRVDILVNNAGIQEAKPLIEVSDASWKRMLDVHLTGTFYCTRAVARVMIKQRYGKIINMASMMGVMGYPGIVPYCSAKAGIIGFTKAAAKELAPFGIRVNAVAPGYILTDLIGGKDISQKSREAFEEKILLRRLGTPEEVASIVCYLASDEAGYIVGETININGGATI